jgi:16S rRNA G527 N7-methylase RsmG
MLKWVDEKRAEVLYFYCNSHMVAYIPHYYQILKKCNRALNLSTIIHMHNLIVSKQVSDAPLQYQLHQLCRDKMLTQNTTLRFFVT